MIEIKNKKNYYSYVIRLTGIIFLGLAVVQVITNSNFISTLIIFFVLELIIFSEKFTESIIINSTDVIIKYYRFFLKKQLVIPKIQTDIRLQRKASFRSPSYLVLVLSRNKRRIYEVDSRNGFQEEDLNKARDFFENVRV